MYYLAFHALVIISQWILIVRCQSSVDLSVSLQPSDSSVGFSVFSASMIANKDTELHSVDPTNIDQLFSSVLPTSALLVSETKHRESNSKSNIIYSLSSSLGIGSDQTTVKTSQNILPSSGIIPTNAAHTNNVSPSASTIQIVTSDESVPSQTSSFLEQILSSTHSIENVPTKASSSDIVKENSNIEQSISNTFVTSNSVSKSSSVMSKHGEVVTQSLISPSDVVEVTYFNSHSSLVVDSIDSVSSTNINQLSIISSTDHLLSSTELSSVAQSNVENIVTTDINLVSVTVSGEITPSQSDSILTTQSSDVVISNSMLTSVFESSAVPTEQAGVSFMMSLDSKSSEVLPANSSAMMSSNKVVNSATVDMISSTILDKHVSTKQTSSLGSILTYSFVSSMVMDTNNPSTTPGLTMFSTDHFQTSNEAYSLLTSDFIMTQSLISSSFFPSSTQNGLEITPTRSKETNSFFESGEITPSRTFSSVMIQNSNLSGGVLGTSEMSSSVVTSSVTVTTQKMNLSDFETKSLFSSDPVVFTLKITETTSAIFESTNQSTESIILPTLVVITTPQANFSAFATSSVFLSPILPFTTNLVNQTNTQSFMSQIMTSSAQTYSSLSPIVITTDVSQSISDLSSAISPTTQVMISANISEGSSLNISQTVVKPTIYFTESLYPSSYSLSSSQQEFFSTSLQTTNYSTHIKNITGFPIPTSILTIHKTIDFNLSTLVQSSVFFNQSMPVFESTTSFNQSVSIFETAVSNVSQSISVLNFTSSASIHITLTPTGDFTHLTTLPTLTVMPSDSVTNFSTNYPALNMTSSSTEFLPTPTSPTESMNMSNTVSSELPTLTFNLTTQPISTLNIFTSLTTLPTEVNDTLLTENLQTANLILSEPRSELFTASGIDNGSVSEVLMTTAMTNISLSSILDFNVSVAMSSTKMPEPTITGGFISSSVIVETVNLTLLSSSFPDVTSSISESLNRSITLSLPSSVMTSRATTNITMETSFVMSSAIESSIVPSTSTKEILSMNFTSSFVQAIPTSTIDVSMYELQTSNVFMSSSQNASSTIPLPSSTRNIFSTSEMSSSKSMETTVVYTSMVDNSSSTTSSYDIQPTSILQSSVEASANQSSQTTTIGLSSTDTMILHSSQYITMALETIAVEGSSLGSIQSSSFQLSTTPSPMVSQSDLVMTSSTIGSAAQSSESLVPSTTSPIFSQSSKVTSTEFSTSDGTTSVMSPAQSQTSVMSTRSTGLNTQTQVLTSQIVTTSGTEMSSSVSMNTVVPTTSSTVPTTTTTPTTPEPTTPKPTTPKPTTPTPTTTENVKAAYWVKTGILVPLTEDVSTVTFKTTIETGLAKAYNLAFQNQQQNGRRKRFVQIGQAGINATDITRAAGKQDVTVGYTVTKAGTTLSATDAVAAASTLSDQMMAIKLGYEVTSKAEAYISQEQAKDDTPSSLWIIGAVVGSVVFVVIVVWAVVCIIYCKYKRSPAAKALDQEGEPPLLRMSSPAGEGENGDVPQYDKVSSEQEVNGTPAYTVTSPKKQKYKIQQDEGLYTEVKKPKHRPSSSKTSTRTDVDSMRVISEDGSTTQDKHRKKRKRKGQAGVAGLDSPEEDDPKLIKSTHLQKYEPQIDEDLQESKDAERKKNKQRLREKRRKREKDMEEMKQYLSGQEEIDAVLSPTADEIPDVFIHKPKKKKGKNKEGQENEGYVEDESLREARKRMHRLLDDAFALISPSGSTSGEEGNKVAPEANNAKEGFQADDIKSNSFKAEPEKKHEPMFVQTQHTPLPEALQTWSPYRAADQVALISMPHSMQTSLSQPTKKNSGKRPVANISYNGPLLTTEAPKPIILRTRELDQTGSLNGMEGYQNGRSTMFNDIGATNSSNLSGLKSSQIGKARPSDSQQGVEMQNLNGKVSHSKQHRPPSKMSNVPDETDIVTTSLYSNTEPPEQTIKSIRDELHSIVNSNKPPPKGRQFLTDIS